MLGPFVEERYLDPVKLKPTVRDQVAERLRSAIPGAFVEVVDLTGTDDHLEARVVSTIFEGKSLVDRHKMVYAPLREWLDDDTVHALAVKTWTPEQHQALSSGSTVHSSTASKE